MLGLRRKALETIQTLGPRFLPFSDVASETLPLSRLLRLSLFQVTVGMALVLLVGTLNRVMIVELSVPATLVGVMISLPIVFAPFRALIGFRSDTHHSALGWRRIPYIWKGTLLQFGGFAVMPFALLVLSGYAEAVHAPAWIGYASAAIAFLLVGAGVHMVQTVGLALATDLVQPEDQPKVVGLMYVMLLLGMMVSAFVFGALLEDYTPGRLIRVIQGAAVVTVVLNVIALWKQEPRDRARAAKPPAQQPFSEAWASFVGQGSALRRLAIIGLGTLGFGMADVLLEPYGAHVLGMSVAETTRLTAILAVGGLAGFALASKVLSKGLDPLAMATIGALTGLPAFAAVMAASIDGAFPLLALGTCLLGFGAGLFGHGTLTATMRAAPREQAGLAIGAWGSVQATAAGLGIALGGVLRDVIVAMPESARLGAEMAYLPVFGLEMIFLALAAAVALPLLPRARRTDAFERRLP
ncbi:MAG: PucC family protein [Pseudomonadota bacterium]